MSPSAQPDKGGASAERLGLKPGMIVMEVGVDDDADEDLRDDVVELTGEEMVGEDSDEVVDVVMLWYRDGDDDLADVLVDAISPAGRRRLHLAADAQARPRQLRRAVRHRRGGLDRRTVPDRRSRPSVTTGRPPGSPAARRREARNDARGTPMIAVGDEAPNFTLKDQNNEDVELSSFRGEKAVLIVFYPLAFTGICTGELTRVRDEIDTFQNDDVQVLTVSVDSRLLAQDLQRARGLPVPAAVGLLAARRRGPGLRRLLRRGRHRQPRHVPGRQGPASSASPR